MSDSTQQRTDRRRRAAGADAASPPRAATEPPLPGAKAPVAIGQVPVLAAVWSLLLIGVGVVAIRDALAHGDLLAGSPWTTEVLESLDDRAAPGWLVVAAAGCLLLAGWLLYAALNPRPRSEAQLLARTGVFLTVASLRRLATTAARDVDGVDTASASASLRRVRVVAITTPDQTDAVQARVRDAVTERLSALSKPPRVRVRMKTTGGQP